MEHLKSNIPFEPKTTFEKILTKVIRSFPKGTIWQSRYIVLPITVIASTLALSHSKLSWGENLLWFVLGIVAWTPMEYILHRFVLHFVPTGPISKAFLDRLHIMHHHDTKDDTQVCMPIFFTGPIWIFLMSVILVLGGNMYGANLFVSGFALMMTLYDITHYSTHYMKPTNRLLVALKKHHMDHHFVDDQHNYGVTSPFWDVVFKTLKNS